MKQAVSHEIFATDKAYELVKKGTPFREAYSMVAENLDKIEIPENIYDGRDFLKFKDYKKEIEERKVFLTHHASRVTGHTS